MVKKGFSQTLSILHEYYTRKSAWQKEQESTPRVKTIWKAFMPNSMSSSADYLTQLAFNVTWSESVFFVKNVVVSNCPYSLKK